MKLRATMGFATLVTAVVLQSGCGNDSSNDNNPPGNASGTNNPTAPTPTPGPTAAPTADLSANQITQVAECDDDMTVLHEEHCQGGTITFTINEDGTYTMNGRNGNLSANDVNTLNAIIDDVTIGGQETCVSGDEVEDTVTLNVTDEAGNASRVYYENRETDQVCHTGALAGAQALHTAVMSLMVREQAAHASPSPSPSPGVSPIPGPSPVDDDNDDDNGDNSGSGSGSGGDND